MAKAASPKDALTARDISRLKDLITQYETSDVLPAFTPDQTATLLAVIKTWDEHSADFFAILERERISKMRAELRKYYLAMLKWFFSGLLVILTALQAIQSVDFSWIWGKK